MKSRGLCFLTRCFGVLLAGLVAPFVRAEEPGPSVPSASASLFESALKQQAAGDSKAACELFEASVAVGPSPHGWLQVGICRESADSLAALDAFEAARALASSVDDPTRRSAYLSAAGEHIDGLVRRIPAVTFRASATPGVVAEMTWVERGVVSPVDRYDEALRFNPGRYQVRAWAPGFSAHVLDLELSEGERRVIALPALQAAAEAARLPAVEPSPPAGDEAAAFAAQGTPPLVFNPLPVSLTAGGLVLVVSGVVVGQLSSNERRRLERECEAPDVFSGERRCSSQLADTKRRMSDLALAADVLWVSGALFAGVGAGLFILDQQRDESPRVTASCVPSYCGLSAAGRF
jgi:hypothetical protein